MAYERPHDLRVEKTIDAIHSTFKQMLLETDFDRITVKELCARARINKKTFYRYYPAIEYLLAEMQQSYEEPFLSQVEGLTFPRDTERITRAFLEFSAAQDELYEKITCAGPHDAIRKEMIAHVAEGHRASAVVPKGWDDASWRLYLAFVNTAPLQVYRAWVEDGKRMSAEKMVETGCLLVCSGAKALERSMR